MNDQDEARDDVPPLPVPTELSAEIWAAFRRHEFALPRCSACTRLVHLPAERCPYCGHADLPMSTLSGRATVYTYATVSRAFHPYFEQRVPYLVGSVIPVEDEQTRFFTRFVDVQPGDLAIGDPVVVQFDDVNDDFSLPLFTLDRSATAPEGGQS
jgi:uncharacterized OB-fold protein